jgi:aryl-alcohol dehydrogenase-like predicted oxidoreductase
VLQSLRRTDLYLGTKVWIASAERNRLAEAITDSLHMSLRRLRRDNVDLLQLHNPLSADGHDDTLTAETVLNEVVPAFTRLRQEGKIRFFGFTALGETPALHRVVDAAVFDVAQVSYNALNPSAGAKVAPGYPAQDYDNLLQRIRDAAMGAIGIRVLAGGALSAVENRHPLGMAVVEPIGSGANYVIDVNRARRLMPLITEGHVESLIEASLRFVLTNPALTTALVGYSSIEQLEYAAACVNKGPLPAAALARLTALQNSFVGEAR